MRLVFIFLFTLVSVLWSQVYAACDITVDSPNGSELISGSHSVTWTGTDTTADATDDCAAVTVDITVSGTTPTAVATGLANTTGSSNSYSWDTSAHTDSSTASITITPVGGLAGTADSSDANFEIDNTAPTLSPVTIASDNGNTDYAKTGDTITLSFTSDEDLAATPTVTIAGQSAAVSGSGSSWSADYTVTGGDTEGVAAITVDGADIAGNSLTQVTATTNGSDVTIDNTAPTGTITEGSGQSDPTNSSPVVFQVVFDEMIDVTTFTSGDIDTTGTTATIGTVSVSEIAPNDGTTFEISIPVTADGDVVATVTTGSVDDMAGNSNSSTVNTDNSVTVDTVAPTITMISSATSDGYYKELDVINVQVTFSEAVTLAGGNFETTMDTGATPFATTINNTTVANVNYSVGSGENSTDLDVSSIALTAGTLQDAAGNDAVLTLPGGNNLADNKAIVVDTVVPTLSVVSIASDNSDTSLATTGNTITVSFTSSEDLAATPTVTIAGQAATVTGGPTSWSATYTVAGTETEGVTAITIDGTDLATNALVQVTAVTDASSVTIDYTKPTGTVTEGSGQSDPTNSSPVVFQVVFDEAIDVISFIAGDVDTTGTTATIGTVSVSEIAPNDGTTFEISIPVTADGDVVATVTTGSVTDPAGNTNSSTVNTDNSVTYDATAPILAEVTPVADPTNDNTPDYTFSSDEAGTISYAGGCSSATTSAAASNNTVTFNTLADGTYASCTITVTDAAGNASGALAVTSFEVDTVAPTLTAVSIASDNSDTSLATTGDTITLTFTSNEDLAATPTVTIAGQSAAVSGSGTSWTATYTVAGTETEGVAAITIDGADIAGNALTQVTAVTDASSVTIDYSAPSLVSFTSTTSDATYGPTSTINVTATYDENVTGSITVDLNNTVTGVVLTCAGGSTDCTGTYTVGATGSGEDVTTLDVSSISSEGATDAAGNTQAGSSMPATTIATASSINVDVTAPALQSFSTSTSAGTYGPTSTINVTATYDENVTGSITVDLNNTVTGVVLTCAGGSTDCTGTYTVGATGSGEDVTTLDVSSISSESATDDYANEQTSSTVPATNISASALVNVDVTAPTLPTVSIESDYALNNAIALQGNVITLSFSADEAIVSTPTVVVSASDASALSPCTTPADVSAGARTDWEVECTVQISDAEGTVTFTVDFVDDYGNNGVQVTSTTDASTVEIQIYGDGGGGSSSVSSVEVVYSTLDNEDEEVSSEDEEVSSEDEEVVDTSEDDEVVGDEEEEMDEDEEDEDDNNNEDDRDENMCEAKCQRDTSEDGFMSYQNHLACGGVVNKKDSCSDAGCTSNVTRKELAQVAVNLGNHAVMDPSNYVGHYTDITSATSPWVRSAVETGFGIGLFSPAKTVFSPDSNVTRAELYGVFMKSVCMPLVRVSDDWQQNVYETARANGLTVRSSENFRPNTQVLRQELFVIGSRLYDYVAETGGCYVKMCK